jgi:hypothetical protein
VRTVGAIAILATACRDAPTAPPAPARYVERAARIDRSGRSEAIAFDVPPGTRSIAVQVTGDPHALYGVASLALAGGDDLVGLPPGPPGPAMVASYQTDRIGRMPGALVQSIRLGRFAMTVPQRPGAAIPAGPAMLQIASDTTGAVAVAIAMPADDGAASLRINVVVIADSIAVDDPPAFVDDVAAIFAHAGIAVTAGRVIELRGGGRGAITDRHEPQDPPDSQASALPSLVATTLAGDPGVDVFVVDSLPPGVLGLSLGSPGFPDRGTTYGVVVRVLDGRIAAWPVAHELGHFLGLYHPEDRDRAGAIHRDPLDDTEPATGNLMDSGGGTSITPDQAWVLRRSPLLR